jgi:hypothetical protein
MVYINVVFADSVTLLYTFIIWAESQNILNKTVDWEIVTFVRVIIYGFAYLVKFSNLNVPRPI